MIMMLIGSGLVAILAMACGTLCGQQGVPVPAGRANSSVADLMPPTHPCTPEQVREYAALTGSDALAHKLMLEMLQGMRVTANPVIPPSMWDEMEAEFAKADLLAGTIPGYQKYLSSEDMDAVLTFYRSGPGQRMLAAQPYIQSVSQDAGKKIGQAIGLNAAMHHKGEIEVRQKQLDKEAAARTGGVQLNVAPAPTEASPGCAKTTTGIEPK